MTSERITYLYDLMDAVYDAPQIRQFSEQFLALQSIERSKRLATPSPTASVD
jgi:hypothetical protein